MKITHAQLFSPNKPSLFTILAEFITTSHGNCCCCWLFLWICWLLMMKIIITSRTGCAHDYIAWKASRDWRARKMSTEPDIQHPSTHTQSPARTPKHHRTRERRQLFSKQHWILPCGGKTIIVCAFSKRSFSEHSQHQYPEVKSTDGATRQKLRTF